MQTLGTTLWDFANVKVEFSNNEKQHKIVGIDPLSVEVESTGEEFEQVREGNVLANLLYNGSHKKKKKKRSSKLIAWPLIPSQHGA